MVIGTEVDLNRDLLDLVEAAGSGENEMREIRADPADADPEVIGVTEAIGPEAIGEASCTDPAVPSGTIQVLMSGCIAFRPSPVDRARRWAQPNRGQAISPLSWGPMGQRRPTTALGDNVEAIERTD